MCAMQNTSSAASPNVEGIASCPLTTVRMNTNPTTFILSSQTFDTPIQNLRESVRDFGDDDRFRFQKLASSSPIQYIQAPFHFGLYSDWCLEVQGNDPAINSCSEMDSEEKVDWMSYDDGWYIKSKRTKEY